jgi:hypothetical protein
VARVIASTRLLGLIFALAFMSGCGGSAQPTPPALTPLSAENLNLIFVVSEDLAYHASGDMNPETANLTNRGLQRTLAMGSFLQENVLGGLNVNGIFALEPMTHLQTAQHYPDVVPLETIQQFAMLNQIMLSYESFVPVANNSFPLNVSYSSAPVPGGVVQPLQMCSSANRLPYSCQGLDFRDADDANETLLSDLINANSSGFYVFSAPWETVKTMMHGVSAIKGYQLSLATAYSGPNYIYAISVTPSGLASFVTYDTQITPSAAYPTLPAGGIVSVPCLPATTNTTFHIQVTGGVGDAVVPAGVNKNETLYMIRHAEAHPTPWWEDGNYVGKGQWRTLDLPYALAGKIHPSVVYSIDPAQVTSGSTSAVGDSYSYVRTDMTVLPYAIANNLPFNLAASFSLLAQNPPQLATQASDFFFTGGTFSNQTLLVGWEHDHIPTTVNALLSTYHAGQTAPNWPDNDFDTVWTIKLDADGNLSVDNDICEGIGSADLPKAPPPF